MSAICGIVGPPGSVDLDGDLRPVLDALYALGPHGTSVWTGEVGGLHVALGARLRHRTPEDERGHRPGTGPLMAAGDIVVAADVVLDNRRTLCAQLGLRGDPDRPDIDIIAAAYHRWGPALAEHLRGDVALAIADRARGGVLLVRDHRGNRPVQVHGRGGVTRFATTALALTASAAIDRTPDVETVRQYLGGGLLHDRSWIEGVTPIPPATARWIDASGTRQRRYWQLPVTPDRSRTFEDHAAGLRSALERAVAGPLARRRGPVASMLSGGLDSTAVVAVAAVQLGPQTVRTYTSVPPPGWVPSTPMRKDPDESRLVQAMADAHPNLRPTFIDAAGCPVLAHHDAVFAAGGVPARNAFNATWIHPLYARAGADGATVLLTGYAGNYGFSATDDRWGVDLLRAGHPGQLIAELRATAIATGRPPGRVVREHLLRPLEPPALRRVRRRVLHRDPATLPTFLRHEHLAGVADTHLAMFDHPGAPRSTPDLAPWFLSAGAEHGAALSALHGLRVVDPTDDVDLLEVCAQHPPWAHHRDGHGRAVARAALDGLVPDVVRLREQRGAQLPDWCARMIERRTEVETEVAALLDAPWAQAWIDLDRVRTAMAEFPGRDEDAEPVHQATYRNALWPTLLASRYLRFLDAPATFGAVDAAEPVRLTSAS